MFPHISLDLLQERREQFFFRQTGDDFALAEKKSHAFAAGNAEVSLTSLTRTVNDATHNRNFKGLVQRWQTPQPVFNLFR